MRLSKKMRFGARAKEYIPYLMENLREGHVVPLCYIVYSGYGKNLYEFYPSSMLKIPNFPRINDEILGLAYGYKDALKLVAGMVEERFKGEGICC